MIDLDSRLGQLESAQLVRRLTEEEGTFIFKHALTQEAAYESLLLKKRSELHHLVALSFEKVYADRLDEFAALLAQHYDLSGDSARAFEYSIKAGDAAMRLNANAEAIAHYTRALRLTRTFRAEASPVPHLVQELAHLYLNRGRALELSSQYVEALANYDEMEKEGIERDDAALKLAALMERAKLYVLPNPNRDLAKGKALILQALDVARQLNDRPAQAKILWNLMLSELYGGGDIASAVANGERSLALAQELGLREQKAFTVNDLGIAYANLGDLERAKIYLEQSRALWRELENLPMLTDNLGSASVHSIYSGDFDEAIRASEEGFELSRSMGHSWGEAHTRFLVGDIYLERGEWAKAIEIMEGAIRAAEQAGNPGVQVGTRAELAWALGSAGAVSRGIELAQVAKETARARFDVLLPWPFAVLARLHLLEGNIEAAERAVKEARSVLVTASLLAPMLVRLAEVELSLAGQDYPQSLVRADELLDYLRERGHRYLQADALYLKAQALVAQSEHAQAFVVLEQARKEAGALGSRRMLWQILTLSGEIEARRGDEARARTARERAREIVSYIADHTPPDLRASFLKLPRIQALMDGLPQDQ